MTILSDCLTEKIDEGCLKVANSLTRRIKEIQPGTTVVSFNRKPRYSDQHLHLNKLFLNWNLFKLFSEKKEPVLYIPFASNTTASCLRTWILSVLNRRRVSVLFVLRYAMGLPAKMFLKMSGATVIALSEMSYSYYSSIVGKKAVYLKTGIDTEKFVPVEVAEKKRLRRKYGIPENAPILLHVGHLKAGRNVDKLVGINDKYHIVLVVSSVTETEKDDSIRRMLLQRGNVTIIDTYLENVQEVYQMADIYLFPVQEVENCIDIPLSALEAASCNLPIVATEYGELSVFKGEEGFCFIDDLSPSSVNRAVDVMLGVKKFDNRSVVAEYDWKHSIETLVNRL